MSADQILRVMLHEMLRPCSHVEWRMLRAILRAVLHRVSGPLSRLPWMRELGWLTTNEKEKKEHLLNALFFLILSKFIFFSPETCIEHYVIESITQAFQLPVFVSRTEEVSYLIKFSPFLTLQLIQWIIKVTAPIYMHEMNSPWNTQQEFCR